MAHAVWRGTDEPLLLRAPAERGGRTADFRACHAHAGVCAQEDAHACVHACVLVHTCAPAQAQRTLPGMTWFVEVAEEQGGSTLACTLLTSILIQPHQGFMEVWGEGATMEELQASIRGAPEHLTAPWMGPDILFKVRPTFPCRGVSALQCQMLSAATAEGKELQGTGTRRTPSWSPHWRLFMRLAIKGFEMSAMRHSVTEVGHSRPRMQKSAHAFVSSTRALHACKCLIL